MVNICLKCNQNAFLIVTLLHCALDLSDKHQFCKLVKMNAYVHLQ